MNILIDATFNPFGGSHVHLIRLVEQFSQNPKVKATVCVLEHNESLIDDLINVGAKLWLVHLGRLKMMRNLLRLGWLHTQLPKLCRKLQADVLFCPGNFGPVHCHTPTVVWMGTIAPFEPTLYPLLTPLTACKLRLLKRHIIASMKQARLVIHQSPYSKQCLSPYAAQPNAHVVLSVGRDERLCISDSGTQYTPQTLSKYPLNNSMIYVSHLYPYKNIERLLQAYAQSEAKRQHHNLLIVGKAIDSQYARKIRHMIDQLKLQDHVHLVGELSKMALQYLYKHAMLMIYPSLYESCGYALIEAMSLGLPILCSNATAMPDTCGLAPVYFNPREMTSITEAMDQVCTDKAQLKAMRLRSLKRASEINTYASLADQLLKLFQSITIDATISHP